MVANPIDAPLPTSAEIAARSTAGVDARSLVSDGQRGSPDAIEALVRAFWGDAFRIALGVVGDRGAAEDIAQDSLIAIVRTLETFDRRREFRPWLFRITTNKALDYVRARGRRDEVPLSADSGTAATLSPPEAAISDEILAALKALEPRERAAIVLRHLFDLRSKEIGEILDLPDGTVRALIHRGLARVRSDLGEENHARSIE